MTVPEKLLAYNRANRAVAILCNHQRAVPKTHGKSMENLQKKISDKREAIERVEEELKVKFYFAPKIFSRFTLFPLFFRISNETEPQKVKSRNQRRRKCWKDFKIN